MTRPIRWLIRIALAIFILAVVAMVAGILLLDTFIRDLMISRMHAATGMEVRISKVHIGLRSPTITIEGLKFYNTAAFGGGLCLNMPELYMEYDRMAARSGSIHFPLVRLNLTEIDVVTDKKGRSNFDAIAKQSKALTSGTSTNVSTNAYAATPANATTGLKFTGIDILNLSLGKLHMSDLRSGQNEEVTFGITNQVFHNVKSEADVTGVAVLLSMRASGSGQKSSFDLNQLLKTLTAH
jgi:uncharacterized protein involved in outer membrane biogenesis